MVSWRGSFLSPAWMAVPIIKDPAEAKPQPTAHGPVWSVVCGPATGWRGIATAAAATLYDATERATATSRVGIENLRIQSSPRCLLQSQHCLPCCVEFRSAFRRNDDATA